MQSDTQVIAPLLCRSRILHELLLRAEAVTTLASTPCIEEHLADLWLRKLCSWGELTLQSLSLAHEALGGWAHRFYDTRRKKSRHRCSEALAPCRR